MSAVAKRKSTEPITLTDPRAIRALAHPARLAVLEELRLGRELTATECADIAGLSASAMSYHLRALQKWGFVERAGTTGDGRERPWRVVGSGGWRVDSALTPVSAAASSAVVTSMFDHMRDDMLGWIDHEREQPKAWRDVGSVSNTAVWLTAAEARELGRHNEALVRKTDGRTPAEHPRGARRVRVGFVVVPALAD